MASLLSIRALLAAKSTPRIPETIPEVGLELRREGYCMSAVANGSRAVVVLVVEDEWLVRRCIADFLHEAGCVVVEAENGERAIHICNSGIPVDVLFTDINLNGSADGWVVAESFRNARDNIPVIYASGNPIDEARCVPGSVHFHKPYRPEDILCACVRLKDAIATRKVDSAGDGDGCSPIGRGA
jgi:CheY-like chemotaxis protein